MEVVKTNGGNNNVKPFMCPCTSMWDDWESIHAPECGCFPAEDLQQEYLKIP